MNNKQSLKEEILKCGRDSSYFISKYVKIQHPKKGLIPFALFDYQTDLLARYNTNRFNIVLKARQLGISEISAAYAVWLMMFHRDKNILVIATKQATATNIIRKVQVAFKNLPKWLILSPITTDNKMSIELSNGSRIKAVASSEDAGRSEALSLLIVDEAAHIDKLDVLWTGLFPTVSAGGKVIMLSTPNGVGNLFHRLYSDADSGENDFYPTRLMWYRHPDRISDIENDPDRPGFKTSSWLRNEIKATKLSPREIAQELECEFIASGETVLAGEVIRWLDEECMLEPAKKELEDRSLYVWFEPRKDVRYLISADVARGDGKDFSTFQVWEAKSMMQVAEFQGKIPVDKFAANLNVIGRKYNSAILVVENNSYGLAVIEHLKLLCYPSLYFSRKGDESQGEVLNASFDVSSDLIPGLTTSSRTRPLIISKLEEYFRNRNLQVYSKRLISELKTFIWKSGRAEAMSGRNDDLVMAAGIGIWIRDTFLASSMGNAEISGKMIDSISTFKTMNTDIDGASKDPFFVGADSARSFNKVYQMKTPGGTILDLSWLIGGKK